MTESSEDFPQTGRLLGVDYGTKRVGIAVSTPDQKIASPLEILTRQNENYDAKYFKEVISEYRISALVVGLPIHVNGTEGQKAREAREYGGWLSQLTNLPVKYWDERYTSVAAEDCMIGIDFTRKQRKRRMDMVAAQIMLQAYLDHQETLRRDAAAVEAEAQDNASESANESLDSAD
ncbi:putative Holliday junction resolvase [Thalassoglobus neptunius]|uniref:Putative pre-16S rRNA nuclease n=1 Tax=Thalassoglobus neptunius TaxID=1938619 RepID=A0A5C5X727_9PLAN|nr:Holliday junction resolvase RuvX [Thalassoglobus neptunius]TWT58704.1 putative Holliday junction resolvase [Thalassoglobus neptunius]